MTTETEWIARNRGALALAFVLLVLYGLRGACIYLETEPVVKRGTFTMRVTGDTNAVVQGKAEYRLPAPLSLGGTSELLSFRFGASDHGKEPSLSFFRDDHWGAGAFVANTGFRPEFTAILAFRVDQVGAFWHDLPGSEIRIDEVGDRWMGRFDIEMAWLDMRVGREEGADTTQHLRVVGSFEMK